MIREFFGVLFWLGAGIMTLVIVALCIRLFFKIILG